MKLPIALLADYANVTKDGKLNVMGVFTDVNAPGFPARHPAMFLVLKFALEFGEVDESKTIDVKLEDEDSQTIHSWPIPLPFQRANTGSRLDTNLLVQLNDIVFPRQGIYQFAVYVDGAPLGEVALRANLIPPAEA